MQDQKLKISLEVRYASAWSEINERVSSRQEIYLYFTVITVTAASILNGYALQELRVLGEKGYWARFLAIGLIFLTWSFAFWIRHNEAIIGLLSTFCKTLEKIDDPDSDLGIPAWHTDSQDWIVEARAFRRYSDYAGVMLAVLSSSPCILLGFIDIFDSRMSLGVLLFFCGLIGVFSAYFIYLNKELRIRISDMKFEKLDNCQWKLLKPRNVRRRA